MVSRNPRQTALVIIDVQNGILSHLDGERGDAARRALDETVGRVSGLLARARDAGLAVFHVQHDGPASHRLAVGSEGWRIRSELAPHPDEILINKTACDAFFRTRLESELRARQIEHVVVAGCMTQYCIDTTVRRAVSLGFDVTLAADGHATGDAGSLRFEQIIGHHNALLDGFDAGDREVSVRPCAALP
ncbi:cysteine hydrolase family protein [Archangium lansingense]|uniref:cysteine hydrolase family protein n=1 Tax=Archangium lansingense TaxID=2995310 RepID=UPI003B77A235